MEIGVLGPNGVFAQSHAAAPPPLDLETAAIPLPKMGETPV